MAMRHSRGADQCAELHERLVVRPSGLAGARQQRLRDCPQHLLPRARLARHVGREHALKHPRDVRVHQLGAALVRERAHRTRGVRADTRQRAQGRRVGRQRASSIASAIRYDPRQCVQVARAGIVAESGPRFRDAAWPCTREVVQRWKGLEECRLLRHHARDLRLLEHQFRHEDAIGIARPAPRQVASMRAKPAS